MIRKNSGINIKELAKSLGLSTSTVSRALNGYTDVNELTRQRVQEAAKTLGYAPDARAQRLVRGRADAVGMVYSAAIGYMGNPQFLATADGIAQHLHQHGQDLLLAVAREDEELPVYQRLLHGGRVDSVIVANTSRKDARIDWLRASGYPFVAYGRTDDCADYSWLDLDNEKAGRLAVEHLLALGHKRFAYIHVDMGFSFAHQRHAGFASALREAGLVCPTQCYVQYANDEHSGAQAAQRLLQMPERPTAVVVDTNLGAAGVVHALRVAGVQPGKEISVVVHGVLPTMAVGDSVVTTVAQPCGRETGALLAELCLGLWRSRSGVPHQILEEPILQKGNTSGPVCER